MAVETATIVSARPTRVESFAKFFKNYMSISAVVAAALPIPVTSFKLIPTYRAHTSLLATYTSLFCFLVLGFIFYSRHTLARLMFPEFFGRRFISTGFEPASETVIRAAKRILRFVVAILPALLILASLTCVYLYHTNLDLSLMGPVLGVDGRTVQVSSASTEATRLEVAESWQIEGGDLLMFLYLGIFLFAEAAFILMALKEYLQDLVKLSEQDLIMGPQRPEAGP
jgi:hypothetical protein